MPILDRLAGNRQFRRFVADPIPGHVKNLRYGFRGWFAKGYVLTFFEFEPPFNRDGLLNRWEEHESTAVRPVIEALVKAHVPRVDKIYTLPVWPSGGSSTWLAIDDESCRGALYAL